MPVSLRLAIRTLGNAPQFSAVALIVLALGLGANAAIFSVVNSVLLQPLPFRDADRLVLLSTTRLQDAGSPLPFSLPEYADVRSQSTVFDGLAAWAFGRGNVSAESPEQVQFVVVTVNLLSMLGSRPAIGRDFDPADDRAGALPVAIISHGLWQRRFASSPAAIGSALRLDGRLYTVVGVLSPRFRFLNAPRDTDVWLPLGSDPFTDRRYARGVRSAAVLGRLKPGVTLEAAQTEVNTIAARLATTYPGDNRGRGMVAMSLREQIVGRLRPAILVLLGAVGVVLLIACANVANLLLARGTARRRELAIRSALGAGRGRLVRQLLAENLVLGVSGGMLGLLVATAGVALFSSLPGGVADLWVPYSIAPDQIGIDRSVVLFTLGLSIATALLFGLTPAVEASRIDLTDSLKDEGHATAGRRAGRLRAVLVVAEVALSAMLLVGAGLLLRTFVHLSRAELGFNPQNVLSFDVSLPPAKYAGPAARAFFDELIARLVARAGVTSVAASEYLPFSGADSATGFFIDGRPAPLPGDDLKTHYRSVTSDYFRTMGMTMIAGRSVTSRDGADAPAVAVINETMARRYWPADNPIGQRMAITLEALRFRRDGPPSLDVSAAMREIVGIVADVKHAGVQADSFPEVYVPFTQRPVRSMTIVVRTAADPLALAADARRAVAALDPDQPIARVGAVADLVAASIARPRFNVLLLSAFATVALVLALVGIYGVMSYTVGLRMHEIGVRLALGGRPRDIASLLVGDGMRLTLIGLGLGLGAAEVVGRAMTGLLVGVTAADPLTLAAAGVFVSAVAFAACYIPARRAMRLDPSVVLRR